MAHFGSFKKIVIGGNGRGYGFIADNDTRSNYYVHWTALQNSDQFRKFKIHDIVQFDIEIQEDGRKRAINVRHFEPPHASTHSVWGAADTDRSEVIEENKVESCPPLEYMYINDRRQLNVGDKLDHRDEYGRFSLATVIAKKGTNLKIHYEGYSKKWDTWIDYNEELYCFAKANSISLQPAHRLKHLTIDSIVYIDPIQRHPGWKRGEIRRFDGKSGQVQVEYEFDDRKYLRWVHLDDDSQIQEYDDNELNDETKENLNHKELKQELRIKELEIIMVKKDQTIFLLEEKIKQLEEEEVNKCIKLKQHIEKLQNEAKLLSVENVNNLDENALIALSSRTEDKIANLWQNLERIRKAREKLVEKSRNCIICFANKKNVVIQCCQHFVLCDQCERKLPQKKCPRCQKPYKKVIKLKI